MKKDILFILICAFIVLICTLLKLGKDVEKYKSLYQTELQNVEAYRVSNSGLEGEILQYQSSLESLRLSKDSIDKKIISVIDELKIKDKRIEYLQYQLNIANRIDTIEFRDTIFEKNVSIDTTINDTWYKLNLKLNYPNTIITSPTFTSEQYVIINTKKAYINKPSKIFFIRWFQKKTTLVEVNIKEKNPYIKSKENKFIKALK